MGAQNRAENNWLNCNEKWVFTDGLEEWVGINVGEKGKLKKKKRICRQKKPATAKMPWHNTLSKVFQITVYRSPVLCHLVIYIESTDSWVSLQTSKTVSLNEAKETMLASSSLIHYYACKDLKTSVSW